MLRTMALLFLLCIAPVAALAAAECPLIVQQAYESVKNVCEQQTARNQACYGNLLLTATPREGANSFSFEQVGDIVDAAAIQSLDLTGMNEAEGHWGVVLMKLQANVPDTLPQQNVTFMLFGDVELTNAVPLEGDTKSTPMQAFYFKASFRDKDCAEAPESGVLVQGPKGLRVQFNVNNVDVTMGSTLFLQTDGVGKAMRINVLEGAAEVEADGVTQVVPEGTFTSIPYDVDEQTVLGAPEYPEPYELDTFDGLPVDDVLPEDFDIADALEEDAIVTAVEDANHDLHDDNAFTIEDSVSDDEPSAP